MIALTPWTSLAVGHFTVSSQKTRESWALRRVTSSFWRARLMRTGVRVWTEGSLAYFPWTTSKSLYLCHNDSGKALQLDNMNFSSFWRFRNFDYLIKVNVSSTSEPLLYIFICIITMQIIYPALYSLFDDFFF